MKSLKFYNSFLLIVAVCLFLCSCKGFEEQLMYNKAEKLHNEGKVNQAIEIYKKLLESDPKDKIHPDNSIIMYDLAVAYIDAGKRTKAIGMVKKLKRKKRADLAREVEKLLYIDESMNR